MTASENLGAALDECSLALGEARAENAQLRDEIARQQLARTDLTQHYERAKARVRDLERQMATLVTQLVPFQRQSWAVVQFRSGVADPGTPRVAAWPVGRDVVGSGSYQILRGPFASDLEACAQLLLSLGVHEDTPEGLAEAIGVVVRLRTRVDQVNAMAMHPALPHPVAPDVHDAAEARLSVVRP